MKTLLTSLFLFYAVSAVWGQHQQIETKSTTIDEFFNVVVNHSVSDTETPIPQNITFLLETYALDFSTEDKTILKHGLKFLSKKLGEADFISLIGYGKYNGIILHKTEATNTKRLLNSIEDLHIRGSDETHDGIELAYKVAKSNYLEDGSNYVVMVRNPNGKPSTDVQALTADHKETKPGSNTLVLTAIALLPEIIKVIKD
ncbi:hypothetical protein [uncultured Winogradskyella sp.]|uniref:hypothetical protein n=1 Tax=uncultured Winogradskyella sp. TaxID=395353 RepID=UPI003514C2B0